VAKALVATWLKVKLYGRPHVYYYARLHDPIVLRATSGPAGLGGHTEVLAFMQIDEAKSLVADLGMMIKKAEAVTGKR